MITATKEEIFKTVNNITGIDVHKCIENEMPLVEVLNYEALNRLSQRLKEKYSIDISFQTYLSEIHTFHDLIHYISHKSEKKKEHTGNLSSGSHGKNFEEAPVNNLSAYLPGQDAVHLNHIVNEQLKVMRLQLGHLNGGVQTDRSNALNSGNQQEQEKTEPKLNLKIESENDQNISHPATDSDPEPPDVRGIKLKEDFDLNVDQQELIQDLIQKYTNKTKKSKQHAQKYRIKLSDWVNSLNFRYTLKEAMYPIVHAKSEGAKIWDIDGNEYIDMAMGYGVSFFGNKPKFIVDAIKRQIALGYELGPQIKLAGEVASLISELTGKERVTFCNTGSEAVMVAVRLARAKTRKKKVVLFGGSYHGVFDGILADRALNQDAMPAAIGIIPNIVKDIVVLDYNMPKSLQYIESHIDELAAVLVEPVQSRYPDIQPVDFLKQLKTITDKSDTALIFDEIITGFRVHPGGIQAHFGVEADIVTYGKVIGGGMPIGIVTGSSKYMDLIDGGKWEYGDDTYPTVKQTFFGGTFCKHPITLAASKAVLMKMKKEGLSITRNMNEITANFASEVNQFFAEENVPFKIIHFASQFRFTGVGRYNPILQPLELDLFFYMLMEKGVYTWERRICFFSTAHTHQDIDTLVCKIKETINEMKNAGFFPGETPKF